MSTTDSKAPISRRSLIELNTAVAIGAALAFALNYTIGIAAMITLGAGSLLSPKLTGARRYVAATLITLTVVFLLSIIFHWPDFKAGLVQGFNAAR